MSDEFILIQETLDLLKCYTPIATFAPLKEIVILTDKKAKN